MRILSIVAIMALVVSVTSKAAQEDALKPAAPQQTAAAGEQAAQVGAPTETSGKVVSLHTVKLVGMSDAHVLVKIQTEQGETDIADLGSAADLKSNGIEPHEGQQLWGTVFLSRDGGSRLPGRPSHMDEWDYTRGAPDVCACRAAGSAARSAVGSGGSCFQREGISSRAGVSVVATRRITSTR